MKLCGRIVARQKKFFLKSQTVANAPLSAMRAAGNQKIVKRFLTSENHRVYSNYWRRKHASNPSVATPLAVRSRLEASPVGSFAGDARRRLSVLVLRLVGMMRTLLHRDGWRHWKPSRAEGAGLRGGPRAAARCFDGLPPARKFAGRFRLSDAGRQSRSSVRTFSPAQEYCPDCRSGNVLRRRVYRQGMYRNLTTACRPASSAHRGHAMRAVLHVARPKR